jgi:hypothetical protein
MNPLLIRERFRNEVSEDDEGDISKSAVNAGLKYLMAAGWVEKVCNGLYEFVDDPRDDKNEQN